MIDTDTAKQFLDYFTDERGGIYLFFVHKSIKGVTKSLEYKGPDTLAEAAKLNEAGFHVYFCSALRSPNFDNKGGSSYGGKKDVSYINGYHVDVDFKSKSGAHAANGSLPTKEEALAIFEQLELEPSYVVNSGNGFQLHFLFDRPLAVDATHTIRVIEKAALAFAEPIQQAFGVKGWDCDAAKTATIQRVWRLPGFDNLKTDPPNPCHIHKAAPSNRIAFSPPSTGQASENAAKKTIDNYGALKKALTERSSKDLPKLWKLVYQGKALPDDQGHNNLTQRMASSIAWANRAQAHPDTLAEILRPSLQHWADQPDASMDIEERLAEVSEQIAKAQVEYIEKRDKEAQATQDQLAEALGDAVPVADARFLICRSGTKNFYPFDFQRKEFCATPQQGYDGLYAFIRTNWTKANGCPVNHKKRSGEQIVDRAPRDYIRENSVQVKVMKKSFIEERSTVKGDERGVKLVLPAGERRFLTAEEAPDVHEWLMALSGDDPEVQRLFTLWIAALYRQEKRSCLLYISGAKNAGKSTFAQGVARMWDASPAKLGQVFERFNGDCENTPIWWADEKMAMPRGVDIAARIRELITLRDHKIERKGHEIYEMEGYGRLIVTANDMKALASPYNSQQSEDGKEATAERILYLCASERAREIMARESEGTKDVERDWIDSNKIAKHVLFLQDKHYDEVTDYPYRMIGSIPVDQDGYKYEKYKLLAPSSQFDSDITTWFSCMLEKMSDQNQVNTHTTIIIRGGSLYLKPSAIGATWNKWDDTSSQGTPPKATAVAGFLRNVCEDKEVRLLMEGGKRTRFKKVIPRRLLQHLDTTLLSEEAALEHFEDLGIDIDAGEE